MLGPIKDETARLADEPTKRARTTKQQERQDVPRSDLESPPPPERSFRERLRDFYDEFPLPKATGLRADKAFFDEMSGEFD